MAFVFVLSLVAVLSTAFLLHQFWSGSLARDEAEASRGERAGDGDAITPLWPQRVDHAA